LGFLTLAWCIGTNGRVSDPHRVGDSWLILATPILILLAFLALSWRISASINCAVSDSGCRFRVRGTSRTTVRHDGAKRRF
jgi:hypothetical protein